MWYVFHGRAVGWGSGPLSELDHPGSLALQLIGRESLLYSIDSQYQTMALDNKGPQEYDPQEYGPQEYDPQEYGPQEYDLKNMAHKSMTLKDMTLCPPIPLPSYALVFI